LSGGKKGIKWKERRNNGRNNERKRKRKEKISESKARQDDGTKSRITKMKYT
jgi:hypothetical protein